MEPLTGSRASQGRPDGLIPGLSCPVVVQGHPLSFSMRALRLALASASVGDRVAYAVALNAPRLERLLTLATFRVHRRQATRTIERGGGRVVAVCGVDPNLFEPACLYELDSPASDYADRCLRPRGPAVRLRRAAARWLGCDPALGAVIVVGEKSCS